MPCKKRRKKDRQKTKKDKEEKLVEKVLKKKEEGFQDPCLIPIFIGSRVVVSLVSTFWDMTGHMKTTTFWDKGGGGG